MNDEADDLTEAFWRWALALRNLRKQGDAVSEARAEYRQMLQIYLLHAGTKIRVRCEDALRLDEEFYGEGPNSAWLWDLDDQDECTVHHPREAALILCD